MAHLGFHTQAEIKADAFPALPLQFSAFLYGILIAL